MSHPPRTGAAVELFVRGSAHVTVTVRTQDPPLVPLRFGRGNAKLNDAIYTFSLPAGHTCPFAGACRSKADRKTGAIREGRKQGDHDFRCYAASMECRWASVRRSRWHNYEQLKQCRTVEEMAGLILDSLTPFAGLVRVHDSGDFWSQDYFDSWLVVAQRRPRTVFYAYTKALPCWLSRLSLVGSGHHPGQLANFVLTASYGGTHDELIAAHGLRSARVVFSTEEAKEFGLPVDHDDGLAMRHGPDFGLLLHGTQPAGTNAARAVIALRNGGFAGYGRTTRFPLRVL